MRSRLSSAPDDLVYTVTEITRKVRGILERNWSAVWVEGELSNVKHHVSGHVYFTLKDDRAALECALFRSDARRVKFRPEDGMKVRAFGGISVYEPRGRYQLITRRLEPLGTGELEIAFRQLYDRLAAEGLFADDAKQPVPGHPRRIGLVTSDSGAALHDLRHVFARRAPHVELVLRPARVQGAGAAREVARAVAELDEHGGCDVLIVARGGGSLEDLQAFNEEIVARALYACRTPVVTGIGHEVDTTIADFVADLRAATPSAAAEVVSPDRAELLEEVAGLRERLALAGAEYLRRRRDRVILLAGSRAFRDPLAYCRQRAQDLDRLTERLGGAGARRVERAELRLTGTVGRLDALSPLAILGRGYAIARTPDGSVLRRADAARPGDGVEVLLGRGRLDCRVEAVQEDEEPRVAAASRRAGEGRDGGA
jgi:exodeoxyribonuclease VII large subunit